jgi:flagellar biosynthesis protein FliQ
MGDDTLTINIPDVCCICLESFESDTKKYTMDCCNNEIHTECLHIFIKHAIQKGQRSERSGRIEGAARAVAIECPLCRKMFKNVYVSIKRTDINEQSISIMVKWLVAIFSIIVIGPFMLWIVSSIIEQIHSN